MWMKMSGVYKLEDFERLRTEGKLLPGEHLPSFTDETQYEMPDDTKWVGEGSFYNGVPKKFRREVKQYEI